MAMASAANIVSAPVIASVTWVDAGTQKAAASASDFPLAHFVIEGTMNPRAGTDGVACGIEFELGLPAQWNNRFFSVTPVIAAGRTRPLCSFPVHAVYEGSGNVDDASSFQCQ